jgi:hypothetical protein
MKSLQSFPELAADFTPPDWVCGNTFSSVLRVTSGNVALWMHYDVFDNLLYQVGENRGHLFVKLFQLDQRPLCLPNPRLGRRPQANNDLRALGPSQTLLRRR